MENKIENLINLLPQPVFEFDNNYNLIFYNKSFLYMLNLTDGLVKNIKISDYICPKETRLENIKNNTERTINECIIKKYNSHDYSTVTMFSYPKFKNNEIIGRFCTLCDITHRKKIELKLQEKEELYKYIIENTHDGIIILKEDGTIDFVNNELLNIFGYETENELINKHFSIFVADIDKERLTEYNVNRMKGIKTPNKYDFKFIKKDGSIRDATIQVSIFTLPDLSRRTLGQILDITDKKELGDKFNSLYETMQSIFDSITDIIWAKDLRNQNIFVNKKFKELFNNNKDIVFNEIFNYDYSMKENKCYHTIEKIFFNNRILWLDICKFPIKKDNELIGVVGVARDITYKVIEEFDLQKEIDKWKKESELKHKNFKELINNTFELIKNASGENNGTR